MLIVGLSCCGFAVWATVSGELQRWTELLMDLSYGVVCLIIVGILIFLNMPFGYGYSVVVISAGFGFGWAALPPVLLGGMFFGPWAAYAFNQFMFFKGKTPQELVDWIPSARAKRLVRAVILGIRLDRCSVMIVAATRSSPLAVGIQLLILSAAAPPLGAFCIGVVVGGLPDLVVSIYIGTLVRSALDQASEETDKADSVKLIVIIVQIVACLLLMALVSFTARRMLKKYDTDDSPEAPQPNEGTTEPTA